MYSAAISPPRWPVPRPSSRSCDRKRTCWRMRSESTDLMAAWAADGSDGSLGAMLREGDDFAAGARSCWAARTPTADINTKVRTIRIDRFDLVEFYSGRRRDQFLEPQPAL